MGAPHAGWGEAALLQMGNGGVGDLSGFHAGAPSIHSVNPALGFGQPQGAGKGSAASFKTTLEQPVQTANHRASSLLWQNA
jgi:hypothetical protein